MLQRRHKARNRKARIRGFDRDLPLDALETIYILTISTYDWFQKA